MTTYSFNGYRPYSAADCFTIDTYTSDIGSFEGNATEEAIRLGYKFIENGATATLDFGYGNEARFVEEVVYD